MTDKRDHGGGIDAARAIYGGDRSDWIDLSTGINPVPYPIPDLPLDAWTALPDQKAQDDLITAARRFWSVPDGVDMIATNGASAPIAQLPGLFPADTYHITTPTYNEHAAAFETHGWSASTGASAARTVVHPNNPDGRIWSADDLPSGPLTVIDESFCDVVPDASLMALAARPNTLILKSFGKFWGLAGLRLGFVIGDPKLVGRLRDILGPWPVSGPALAIGTAALNDPKWADATRADLARDARRLDALMAQHDIKTVGGTDLFRLYDVGDAAAWQDRLGQSHILGRIFPYSDRWLRLGLPAPAHWDRLEAAL